MNPKIIRAIAALSVVAASSQVASTAFAHSRAISPDHDGTAQNHHATAGRKTPQRAKQAHEAHEQHEGHGHSQSHR